MPDLPDPIRVPDTDDWTRRRTAWIEGLRPHLAAHPVLADLHALMLHDCPDAEAFTDLEREAEDYCADHGIPVDVVRQATRWGPCTRP